MYVRFFFVVILKHVFLGRVYPSIFFFLEFWLIKYFPIGWLCVRQQRRILSWLWKQTTQIPMQDIGFQNCISSTMSPGRAKLCKFCLFGVKIGHLQSADTYHRSCAILLHAFKQDQIDLHAPLKRFLAFPNLYYWT